MMTDIVRSLVVDDPIPALLGGDMRWKRVYGRASARNRATLVYEPETGASDSVCVHAGPEGLTSFPVWNDVALPALDRLRKTRPEVRVVRYRPGKRCTLRLNAQRPLFLKCVTDDRGQAINSEARLLDRAQRAGMFGFAVARPAGWLPGFRILAQHRVEGQPVVPRIWSDPELAARLGEANASLALSAVRPAAQFAYADQVERTAKYARRLEKRLPDSAPLLAEIMRHLRTVSPGPADRPIHGAPHAHQWLEGPGSIGLVDFDRFSIGDPELDVATFVAEADFEDAPGARGAARAYADAFDWRSPLNEDLMRAYRIHKHVAKALRVATAIRLDADARAIAILDAARRMAP